LILGSLTGSQERLERQHKLVALKQPKNLNLFTIRFPMPAIVSILHRMSGVLIFLLLPLITYLFCLSILSEEGYLKVIELLNLWPIQVIKLFLTWGIVHHLIAGCRHLLLDMLIGNDLIVARFTSKTVLIISLLLTLIIYIL